VVLRWLARLCQKLSAEIANASQPVGLAVRLVYV